MKENKNFKLKSICHSEEALATEESFNRFFAFAQNDGESGRSMVEMLGVLAVIGVLSVAGIAGYSIAMRSYRTNEIINAASMLYVLASTQNAGNGPTNNVAYTDFGKSNPSGVSTLQYNKDEKTITMTFTYTDDCTTAKNKLGDKASGDCPTLTVTLENTTGEGTSCTLTADDCASGALTPEGCACAPATNNENCSKYDVNECGFGYYCDIEYNNEAFSGHCVQIQNTNQKYLEDDMNWWTAYSFCKGLGSNMVTHATAGCESDNSMTGCADTPWKYWFNECYRAEASVYINEPCNGHNVAAGVMHGDEYSSLENKDYHVLCE